MVWWNGFVLFVVITMMTTIIAEESINNIYKVNNQRQQPIKASTTSTPIQHEQGQDNDNKLLLLNNVTILITAPTSYANRLRKHLEYAGARVISCPTVETTFLSDPIDQTKLEEEIFFIKKKSSNNAGNDFFNDETEVREEKDLPINLQSYDYVAFTSRRGIEAMLRVEDKSLSTSTSTSSISATTKIISCFTKQQPTAIALGVDAEALIAAGVPRSCILIPPKDESTPSGIVKLLRDAIFSSVKKKNYVDENNGHDHKNDKSNKDYDDSDSNQRNVERKEQRHRKEEIRILCPVPKVIGLTEPNVVPDFLLKLKEMSSLSSSSSSSKKKREDNNGKDAVDVEEVIVKRIDAYETKWTGWTIQTKEAIKLLREGKIDIIAISSTTEVEGLQRFLVEYNDNDENGGNGKNDDHQDVFDFKRILSKYGTKVASHGPVTAKGAETYGLYVDAISKDSSSFAGMVDACYMCL